MEIGELVLPTIATVALAAAILVPLRDSRLGRRATIRGATPLQTTFPTQERTLEPTWFDRFVRSCAKLFLSQHVVVEAASENTVDGTSTEQNEDRGDLTMEDAFAERQRRAEAAAANDGDVTVERSFESELQSLIAPRCLPTVPAEDESPSEKGVEISTAPEKAAPRDVVVPPAALRADRIVPLTRRPLRPIPFAMTWTECVAELSGVDEVGRHAWIAARTTVLTDDERRILTTAFHEENEVGRLSVLGVLTRARDVLSRSIFESALASGTDRERVAAIEGLIAIDAREALIPVLADRVDAVAARAAYALFGHLDRASFAPRLLDHVDETRARTILALLAGIVE